MSKEQKFYYLYGARNKKSQGMTSMGKYSRVWYQRLGQLRQALTLASNGNGYGPPLNKRNYEIVRFKVIEEGLEPMVKGGTV